MKLLKLYNTLRNNLFDGVFKPVDKPVEYSPKDKKIEFALRDFGSAGGYMVTNFYGCGIEPISRGYGNKSAITFQTETPIVNCRNCGANDHKENKCKYCGTKY